MVEWLDTPGRHDPEWYETVLQNWETLQSRLESGNLGVGTQEAAAVTGLETAEGDGSRTVFEWPVDAPYEIAWASVEAHTEAASADHYVFTTSNTIGIQYSTPPADGAQLEWMWAVGREYGGRAGEVDVEEPVGIGDYYETEADGEMVEFRWDTGVNSSDQLQYLNVDPASEAATDYFTRGFDGTDIVVTYKEPPEAGETVAWYWAINSFYEVDASGILYDQLDDRLKFNVGDETVAFLDSDGTLHLEGGIQGGNIEPVGDGSEDNGIEYHENGQVFTFHVDGEEVAQLDGNGDLTLDGGIEGGGSATYSQADIDYLLSQIERLEREIGHLEERI